MDDAPSLLNELENEFCPPLDPALFVAIVSDYDLDDQSAVQQLRETLDALKISAYEQEDALFDPSGTSGFDFPEDASGIASAQSEPQTLSSHETNTTSLGSNVSSLGAESSNDSGRRARSINNDSKHSGDPTTAIKGLNRSNSEDQAQYLHEMFPSIDRYTVLHTLDKYGGNVDKAMDVLLNLSFFENSQNSGADEDQISVPKGIAGFERPVDNGKSRRKSKKNKNKQHLQHLSESDLSQTSLSDSSGVKPENRWDNGKKDMEFICSRTTLAMSAVSSAYHSNRASLPATIRALTREEAKKYSAEDIEDSVTHTQIAELQEEFSAIPRNDLVGLLKLTRNCISAANELARMMIVEPVPSLIQPEYRPAGPSGSLQATTNSSTNRPSTRAISVPAATGARPNYNPVISRAIADRHLIASQQAFEKAHSAYRRGKSDRLMGGAAGYYSSVGREHFEKAKKESAIAADALVYSQSSSNVLDLHGVSVQDAVRIAKEGVESWWESLGDEKYSNRLRSKHGARSYRVVTGLGRHSKNGTARLGPAVARCLVREGWKVEVERGALVVTGQAGY
ncbi:smr domain-containing protein [Nannizzia gypsea CBS 118893]|uniref:Smr domain-containing protein n=1 Tax=Arthroderma gypseum (strain ATCC MYA-4604 / CBS 118893) TaxID=535722 RepID=E5R161_ARTGP|nr:smr domain-containing protein [Nannizzia gypsea CBS 118893]EFQ98450.1 smr domain-containing protein [Nannizzia gypsea CBS 118893]